MNNEHGKARKGKKWILVLPVSKITLKDMNAVSYPSLSLCCRDNIIIYSSFHTQSFCLVWEILQKWVYLAVIKFMLWKSWSKITWHVFIKVKYIKIVEKSHLVENSKRAMVNFPNITNKILRISKECLLLCVSTTYMWVWPEKWRT